MKHFILNYIKVFSVSAGTFAVTFCGATLTHAQADNSNNTFLGMSLGRRMEFGERTYPLGVTLQSQVSVKQQKHGACHVFAAVAAAQAACSRRTKRVLRLSEGYLFARHLRGETENSKSFPFLTINFTSLFSENDAGYYGTTLSRIEQGDVRLDSEFSMDDLDRILIRPTATRAGATVGWSAG